MILVCAWSFPILVGLSLVGALNLGGHKGLAPLILRLALAVGLGIGITSLTFYCWMEIFKPTPIIVLAGEGFLFLTFSIIWWIRKPNQSVPLSRKENLSEEEKRIALRLIVYAVGIGLTALLFVAVHLFRFPHGGWDAWSFWTLRARFVYRGDSGWNEMFRLPGYFHPEYPLMTTSFIARNWIVIGRETPIVCYFISVTMMLGCLLVPATAISILRDRLLAALAVLSILLPAAFMVNAARLMADIPLAFYATAAVVCFSVGSRSLEDNTGWFLMSGMFLGMACWTKCEGLLWLFCFFAAIGFGCLGQRDRSLQCRRGYFILVGAAPSLIVLCWFKAGIPYDEIPFLVPRFSIHEFDRLLDVKRVTNVLLGVCKGTLNFGGMGLLAYAILLWSCGWNIRNHGGSSVPMLMGVLLLVSIGYVAAFVVSLNSVNIEVSGSVNRLLTHLWPSFVYLTLMATNFKSISEERLTPNPVLD